MEPFRGKASGKACPSCGWPLPKVLPPSRTHEGALHLRIAELEAEVERLKAEVKKEHDRAEYNAWAAVKNAVAKIESIPRVNPSGDTLGKERDDGCSARTHTVVHADGNVCPFLVPRSP